MVKFKIKRDDARIIDKSFMPYMVMVAEMKMRDAENNNTFLTAKIFLSLICQVKLAFKKKLLNTPNNLTFKLSDAEGVAFYKFLMEQPIEDTQVYVATFRQQLCDLLHKQLIEPYLPHEDPEEVEETDFIKSI